MKKDKVIKKEQKQMCSDLQIQKCLARRVLCICNIILKHPLFKNIERPETHKLSKISDVIKLNSSKKLFFCGEELDKIYFVLEGKIKLYKNDNNSDKSFISNIAVKGDGIALEMLFGNSLEAAFSAEAIEESTVLVLDRKKLKRVIQNNPVIMENLLSCLSAQINSMDESRIDLALTEVSERLLKFLANESKRLCSNEFEIEISKSDLAQLLGTIPATLSRAIKKLSNEKLISVKDSNFTVH